MMNEAIAFFRALFDPRTPRTALLPAVIGLVYVVFPFDLLPDVIPLLGQIDDAAVVSGLLWATYRMIPRHVLEDHRQRAHNRP